MRRLLALAALAAGLAALAPAPPSAAQGTVTACVANQAGYTVRSRFTYIAGDGREYTSAWVTSMLGQRNCHAFWDVRRVTIKVQALGVDWNDVCERSFSGGDAARSRTLFVTGTAFGRHCEVEG